MYFHQNQLPFNSPETVFLLVCFVFVFFLGGTHRSHSSFLKRRLKKPTGDGQRGPSQPEAGKGSRMLAGLSDKAILFSLPTSACQPGIFLVVMWRRACFVRWSLRMKRRSHTGHTNFFSPVWVLRWRDSSSDLANFLSQPSQLQVKGFSPGGKQIKVRVCTQHLPEGCSQVSSPNLRRGTPAWVAQESANPPPNTSSDPAVCMPKPTGITLG